MLLIALLLLGSLVMLIAGAWCVSEGADILGSKYDATIVGALIIAWLNTLPETIFFVTALENNQPTFAMGAISGSVIVVSTVAVGCCIFVGASVRPSKTVYLLHGVRKQALALGASLVLMAMILLFGFHSYFGFAGIAMYCAFVLWTLLRKGRDTADTAFGHEEDSNTDLPGNSSGDNTMSGGNILYSVTSGKNGGSSGGNDDDDDDEQPLWKGIAYLIAGGVIIYAFSDPFITSVVKIGEMMGVGPLALAFFFAPIASEAPEIIESITLSRKGKTQNINIAFSNLVSGTISKTTLLTGIFCLYSTSRGYEWISPSYTVSVLLIMISSASAAAFGLQTEHPAARGKALMALFLFCAAVQFISAYSSGQDVLLENVV